MALPAEPKPATRNRKEFVRTKVPISERIAGIICTLLLVVITAVIWWKGRHFDPSRFALKVDALKSTTEEVQGKAATLRGDAAEGRGVVQTATAGAGGEAKPAAAAAQEGGEGKPAAPAPKGEQLVMTVAGIKPMGDTEFYNADTLYEKIDGRAPAYLGFNFQGLRNRSFEVLGEAGSYVDVYEYRFDSPVDAFGMFAAERDPKGKTLDFAPDGYSGEMGFFFRQAAVYVQVIASDTKEKTMAIATAIAQDRAKAIPADNVGLDARRRLPATGLDPKSVEFEAENALGQDFLKNVFQGRYDFGGKSLSFFIMVSKADEAAAAWKSFLDFSGKYGGQATTLSDVNGAKVFQASNSGLWRVVYQKDGEIGGVFDADDVDKARQFVEEYLQGKIQ